MGHIVADPVLLERLTGLLEPVEIRAPSGEVVGQFTPAVTPETTRRYAEAARLFDLQEAKRRFQEEKTGRTTAEVLARLEERE